MKTGQLLKTRLQRAGAEDGPAWVNGRALPGQLLMKMRLWQVAREVAAREVAGEVAAWEVAWESGSSARPACPSLGLSAATHPTRSKADHQSQGRLQGFHGRSVGFAPRVGQAL